jgi:phosphoribosylamine--glycine ligase
MCWKLKQSPLLGKLFCIPGNAGISQVAECVPSIGAADVPQVILRPTLRANIPILFNIIQKILMFSILLKILNSGIQARNYAR